MEKAEAEKTKEEEDQEEIEDLDDFVYIQGTQFINRAQCRLKNVKNLTLKIDFKL